MAGFSAAFFVPAGTLFFVMVSFYIFQVNTPEDVGLPPIEPLDTENPLGNDDPGSRESDEEDTWQVVRDTITNPSDFF